MNTHTFVKIADLAVGAKHRRMREYDALMQFYRSLVDAVPSEAAELFGKMNVTVYEDGKRADWGLYISATDYMWWKNKIATGKVRFWASIDAIKAEMLNRFAEQVEKDGLSLEERQNLLRLLEEAEGA